MWQTPHFTAYSPPLVLTQGVSHEVLKHNTTIPGGGVWQAPHITAYALPLVLTQGASPEALLATPMAAGGPSGQSAGGLLPDGIGEEATTALLEGLPIEDVD